MTTFDHIRLTNEVFKLDVERMRQGWYSDKYFENISAMLTHLAAAGYHYAGQAPRLHVPHLDEVEVGNLEVEMQWFTRRPGNTIVVGVDKCLEMLRHCAGYVENGDFINTWDRLQVEAVHDGDVVRYAGDPKRVMPVIRVRGRYRDFALLETPTLGILTRERWQMVFLDSPGILEPDAQQPGARGRTPAEGGTGRRTCTGPSPEGARGGAGGRNRAVHGAGRQCLAAGVAGPSRGGTGARVHGGPCGGVHDG